MIVHCNSRKLTLILVMIVSCHIPCNSATSSFASQNNVNNSLQQKSQSPAFVKIDLSGAFHCLIKGSKYYSTTQQDDYDDSLSTIQSDDDDAVKTNYNNIVDFNGSSSEIPIGRAVPLFDNYKSKNLPAIWLTGVYNFSKVWYGLTHVGTRLRWVLVGSHQQKETNDKFLPSLIDLHMQQELQRPILGTLTTKSTTTSTPPIRLTIDWQRNHIENDIQPIESTNNRNCPFIECSWDDRRKFRLGCCLPLNQRLQVFYHHNFVSDIQKQNDPLLPLFHNPSSKNNDNNDDYNADWWLPDLQWNALLGELSSENFVQTKILKRPCSIRFMVKRQLPTSWSSFWNSNEEECQTNIQLKLAITGQGGPTNIDINNDIYCNNNGGTTWATSATLDAVVEDLLPTSRLLIHHETNVPSSLKK